MRGKKKGLKKKKNKIKRTKKKGKFFGEEERVASSFAALESCSRLKKKMWK